MLLVSIGALTIAFLGGARLVLDIFSEGLVSSLGGIGTKAFVIGLAYLVGWLTAMVAIRVYGNLIMPIIIKTFIWGCLVVVCVLYLLILQRLYTQRYDTLHYWAYLVIIAASLVAMVGLHLIIEDHDLRPFSIPLLIINLIQLGLIVFRYVFTGTADASFLWKDLIFFAGMAAFSIFMLAHWPASYACN
jgi:predicted neutral ceramidase superfamily lipid hydrolase